MRWGIYIIVSVALFIFSIACHGTSNTALVVAGVTLFIATIGLVHELRRDFHIFAFYGMLVSFLVTLAALIGFLDSGITSISSWVMLVAALLCGCFCFVTLGLWNDKEDSVPDLLVE